MSRSADEQRSLGNSFLVSSVVTYVVTYFAFGPAYGFGCVLVMLLGLGLHLRASRRERTQVSPEQSPETEESEAACCDQGALVWPKRCPWHPDGPPEPEPPAQPETMTVWRAEKSPRNIAVGSDSRVASTKPAAPNLTREDVRRLHGVYCYRDLNRRPDEPDHGRYGDPEREHPLSGCCICHHAVWHSCPAPQVGARMFEALPLRVSAPRAEARTLDEIDYVRHQLTEAQDQSERYRRHLASVLDDLQRARRTP